MLAPLFSGAVKKSRLLCTILVPHENVYAVVSMFWSQTDDSDSVTSNYVCVIHIMNWYRAANQNKKQSRVFKYKNYKLFYKSL